MDEARLTVSLERLGRLIVDLGEAVRMTTNAADDASRALKAFQRLLEAVEAKGGR